MKAYHILLVDDDPLILKTVGDALQEAGYRITTADSGEAAKPVTVVRTALNSSEDLLPPEMMLYLEKQKQAAGQQEATDKN